MQPIYPITHSLDAQCRPGKPDRRYTITQEYLGYSTPLYAVRFCDELIGACHYLSKAHLVAVTHRARMNGALVIEGMPAHA